MAEEFSFSVDSDWKKQAQEEKRRLAEESAKPAASPAPAPQASSRPSTRRRRRSAEDLPEPSFAALVQTLASQALLYMGGVAVSAAGEGIVDLDQAKQQIDLLTVLEEKTQGNLSDDERATLDVTLYETRMRFVGVASRYIL